MKKDGNNRRVVQELFADRFRVDEIRGELAKLLPGRQGRQQMMRDYEAVRAALGKEVAPDNAAHIMVKMLKRNADKC